MQTDKDLYKLSGRPTTIPKFYKQYPRHLCFFPSDNIDYQPFPYGSEIKNDNKQPTYFEKKYKHTVIAPWLAHSQEKTFMNRTKMLNENDVLTYRDIVLSNIPTEKYQSPQPIIYTVEKFDEKQINQKSFLILLIIIILLSLIFSIS